jgi:hypothetical protein
MMEKRMDALEHMIKTEADETERKEIQEELDKLYVEYNKLMNS